METGLYTALAAGGVWAGYRAFEYGGDADGIWETLAWVAVLLLAALTASFFLLLLAIRAS